LLVKQEHLIDLFIEYLPSQHLVLEFCHS